MKFSEYGFYVGLALLFFAPIIGVLVSVVCAVIADNTKH
jgi:hypothetical protein